MAMELRNFKDFLLLYNQISETCFRNCTNTLLSREVTPSEDLCINNCAQKYVHANHRIMQIFMEVQPVIVRKRMEEVNATQETLESQIQDQQVEPTPQ